MANFYVTNSRYPSNPQLFTIALNKVRGLGTKEDNPNFKPTYWLGEPVWKVLIHTSGLDNEGNSVGPIIADVVGSSEDVNEFVETAVEELCGLIDWSQQGAYTAELDQSAPYVEEQYPGRGQENIPISSPIVIRVKEPLPGAGIDPESVVMKVDGYEVTPSYSGNKFDYTFSFKPRPVYED